MKILLIDDDQAILEALGEILAMWDFNVTTFHSSRAAVEAFGKHPFDLVVTDIRMPEMDGIDVLKAVKEHEPETPVVVMTGFADASSSIAALNLGAHSLITKPLDTKEFIKTLERIREEIKIHKKAQFKIESCDKACLELDSVYQELQSYVVVVDQMQAISRKFQASLDLRKIINELLNNTSLLLGCKYCLIAVKNEDSSRIFFYSNNSSLQESFPPEGVDYRVNPFLNRWLNETKIILENEPSAELTKQLGKMGFSVKNLLSVSLPQNNQVLGLLAGFNKPGGFTSGDKFLLNAVGGTAVTAVSIARLISRLNRLFVKTIESLAKAIDAKDKYTRGHTGRVSDYTVKIARRLKWDPEKIEHAYIGALLHDIGKIGIPDGILNKSGTLTSGEYEDIKSHVTIGYEIISGIPEMKEMLDYIHCHHERYDGLGYPRGLKGKRIPIEGRIISIADSFDAMTSDRSYRKALSIDEALTELKKNAGIQFDPELVEIFESIIMDERKTKNPEVGIVKPRGSEIPIDRSVPAAGVTIWNLSRLPDASRPNSYAGDAQSAPIASSATAK